MRFFWNASAFYLDCFAIFLFLFPYIKLKQLLLWNRSSCRLFCVTMGGINLYGNRRILCLNLGVRILLLYSEVKLSIVLQLEEKFEDTKGVRNRTR